MDAPVAIQILAGVLLALLAISAVTDWRWRTVPDLIPVSIFAIIVLAVIFMPALQSDALSRGLALIVMVVTGTLLGATRILGGGDIKLLAALAPWHGLAGLPVALLSIAAAGGILALGFVVHAALIGRGWRSGLKSRVPYAIAILAGEAALAVPLFL